MNQELLTLNLSDLETLISKSNCSCHFINPNKTRIILWVKENSETYYLRIGIQKFISYPLKDKNQALYWRFNCFEIKSSEIPTNLSETEKEFKTNDPDPITKFRQRQTKTAELNNHANNSESNSN